MIRAALHLAACRLRLRAIAKARPVWEPLRPAPRPGTPAADQLEQWRHTVVLPSSAVALWCAGNVLDALAGHPARPTPGVRP